MAEESGFKRSNTSENAGDQGYAVKQLPGSDSMETAPELDAGWRTKQPGGSGELAGDVQARELAENDVAREARRKIIEILNEDEPPARVQHQAPTGQLRKKNPGLSMEDLMDADELAAIGGGINDAANTAALDLFHSGYMQDDNEAAQLAESMAGRPNAPAEATWDWVTIKAVATLQNKKRVPVWMVENRVSGMKMEKPFRVQGPAEKIASILNITGNANDPRIGQLKEDYDRYVTLTKQARKCKQLVESGDQNARKTGTRVVAELRGVKQRLGI
jgi:hypothetical protein